MKSDEQPVNAARDGSALETPQWRDERVAVDLAKEHLPLRRILRVPLAGSVEEQGLHGPLGPLCLQRAGPHS